MNIRMMVGKNTIHLEEKLLIKLGMFYIYNQFYLEKNLQSLNNFC